MKRSDLVIAIGYDPIEYEARNWNAEKDARIIVIKESNITRLDWPMSEERSVLRMNLISGLLDDISYNLQKQINQKILLQQSFHLLLVLRFFIGSARRGVTE